MTMHPALVRSRAGVLVADGVTGLVLWILSVAFVTLSGVDADAGVGGRLVFMLAAAVMAAAVTVRRLHPAWALGLAWASTLVHLLAGLDASLTQVGALIVLASAAHFGSARVLALSGASVAAGTVTAVGYLLLIDSWLVQLLSANPVFPTWLPLALLITLVALTLAVPWLVGLLARTIRLSREERDGARTAQEEARRAGEIAQLQAARTALARDVHDIVGHSLAVIIAQAESVRFREVDDPDGLAAVRGTAATIAETARRALGEVRSVLESTAAGEGSSPFPPADPPLIALDLDQLLTDVERSRPGMIVERRTATVPAGEGLIALFRAVQELLTNALRHGDASAPLVVSLAETEGSVEVVIENAVEPGSDQTAVVARSGTGLGGAHARLEAVGGSLTTSTHGRTFRAVVRVPTRASSS